MEKRVEQGEVTLRLAWWGSTEKEVSYLLGLRGRYLHSGRIRVPCTVSAATGAKGEEDQMVKSSTQ